MATDTEPTDTGMLLLTPMDITATTARDLLMPSPDMGTTAIMGTEVTAEDIMATVATEDTTTARGLLMLSPDTATVMGTEVTMGATMAMVMVMATDTMVEKFQKFMLIQSDLEFSTNEFGPLWY